MHPVKEKNEININNETDIKETENIHQEKDSTSSVKTKDNSLINAKTEIRSKDEKETGLEWWQKMFIVIGVSCLIGFVSWLIYKFK